MQKLGEDKKIKKTWFILLAVTVNYLVNLNFLFFIFYFLLTKPQFYLEYKVLGPVNLNQLLSVYPGKHFEWGLGGTLSSHRSMWVLLVISWQVPGTPATLLCGRQSWVLRTLLRSTLTFQIWKTYHLSFEPNSIVYTNINEQQKKKLLYSFNAKNFLKKQLPCILGRTML